MPVGRAEFEMSFRVCPRRNNSRASQAHARPATAKGPTSLRFSRSAAPIEEGAARYRSPPPPARTCWVRRPGEKQRPFSFSPLLAPATRSREAAMVAASPAEGAMTVRKGMISRLECENFKCVPDTSRVAPIRAVPPRCAVAFPRLARARQISSEDENAVRERPSTPRIRSL